MEAKDEKVPRDAFGHVRMDEINPGLWYAKQFSNRLEAQKVLVQKSGYFARSAAANPSDLDLIKRSASLAAECGLLGQNGVVGLDEDNNDELSLIDFDRIKGGKPFNSDQNWFQDMLKEIN
jgi:pyrophosphate--fructose-6-phosphate 1-phosphotransferase